MPSKTGLLLSCPLVLLCVSALAGGQRAAPQPAAAPRNMLANPSFETGRSSWHMNRAGSTAGTFVLDSKDAADGSHSALVTVGRVEKWGTQFGQFTDAGKKGKTCTFAAFVRSAAGPTEVSLRVERHAWPWDAAGQASSLKIDERWKELHVTFRVEKDFPQGWFAFVGCSKPDSRFRVDMCRLYEGRYVPFKQWDRQRADTAGVKLFDTGGSSPAPLGGEDLARRQGWKRVPEGDVAHRFNGDAVFMNNRLAVVLRRMGRGAEVYSMGGKAPKPRALLSPVAPAGPAGALTSVNVLANTANGVMLEAAFAAGQAASARLRCRLRMGQVFVETVPGDGVGSLRVSAPCRFAVLPDFFADDIVVDAAELPVARAPLPGENFLLHMLDGGEAIAMAVWDRRGEDVRIGLSGRGKERAIAWSEIPYGEKGRVWLAVMTGRGIWHTRDVGKSDVGKVLRLDWRMPFPAQWRVDWRRSDDLADSWEMIARRADRKFVKHGWFGSPGTIPPNRLRWTTVIGRVPYPCWIERDGRGFLQPLKSKVLRFEGPAVIYPINRVRGTPLDAYTVVDIVRGTLGVGPCEYILDVEGQQSQYKGRATCSNRDTLNPIYKTGRQKARRAVIEKSLTEVMVFVRHIRGRIEQYRTFGREVLAYLAERKQAHPELAGPLGELEKLAGGIEAAVTSRRAKIKTPEEAQVMVDEFRRTMLDYEGSGAYARCKEFTAAMVEIGGNQDELVGECRWAVKVLRQRAGLLMAAEPRVADVAGEIRRRTQKVLRNPASHEGARH